jgi:methionyl aminopeptidase
MSIASERDWTGLRRVARVVRLTLDALEREVRPGITTAELNAVAAAVLEKHRARSAPLLVYGFPGSALISVNDQVVHGVPGPRRLEPGDVVKLDVTVEKDGYMADAARTVTVQARTLQSPESTVLLAERLARCARSAFEKALEVTRVGRRVSEIGRVVDREVRSEGFQIVRGLDGHGIGRTIHEPPSVPNYFDPSQTDVLTEGLVITIEPIICSGSGRAVEDVDGWTIRTADGSLAAHYEHTLVVTGEGPVVLTAA